MRWSAVLVVLMLTLAACQQAGTGASEPAGSEPAATDGGGEIPEDELGVVEIPEGEPLNIGFWGVISGADAALGVDSQRGVEIAIEDRGGELLGHEIQLTAEDGLC